MSETASADTPLARVGRLDTAREVRRELARLYRAGRRGDIPASDASRLASILNSIVHVIEVAELEQRLNGLESERGRENP